MEREDRCYLCGILPPYTGGIYAAEDRICRNCMEGESAGPSLVFATALSLIVGAFLVGAAAIGAWVGGCISP